MPVAAAIVLPIPIEQLVSRNANEAKGIRPLIRAEAANDA